jgi:hypothetical protein
MSEHMPPEFEERIHDLLAAPDADPVFVDGLRSKILERTKMKTHHRFSPRLAWAIAIALVLLIIGLLAFSPRVVEAMKRLLGYVPGVGYVEQGITLRVLSAPVIVEKDGLTVTIEKGVADTQHTVLLARVEGYTANNYGAQTCVTHSQLRLADGTILHEGRMEAGTESKSADAASNYFVRYEYPVMPPKQVDATLEIPCLMFDANFKDWQIPLHFQVAEGTNQVIPVIDLPTALPPQPSPTGASTTSTETAPEGFSVVLKSEAELGDGYVLSGSYQWSDPRYDQTAVTVSSMDILDANGQAVPFQEVNTDPSAELGPRQIPFVYQITGKKFAWPLKIIVNAISVVEPGQGTFQFDPGPDPQIDQTWNVNIDVPVGQHIIYVETIKLTAGREPTMVGYDFTMTSDPFVAGAAVDDKDPIIVCKDGCGGGGGGGGGFGVGPSGFVGATGPFSYGWSMNGYSPAGVKTFVISGMSVFFKGPWQVSWQPSSP